MFVCEEQSSYLNEQQEDESVFVDLLSDSGFKIVFGDSGEEDTETNKLDSTVLKRGDLLKNMLNAFFDDRIPKITKVRFRNSEVLGKSVHHRKVIYDLYFEDGSKRRFVVEMQKDEISFMLNRIHNYTSLAHSNAMKKGKKFKHDQHAIIGVVIANFVLHENKKMPCISIIENGDMKAGAVAMDLTKIMTVELPKFNKKIDELVDDKDKYLFLLKHMGELKDIPVQFDTEEFRPIFECARIANLKKEDYMLFDEERTLERRRELVMETAVNKAVEKERKKAKEETISLLLQENCLPLERIATVMRVGIEEVLRIKNALALS